jgi:chromosome segregation ATPase
LLKPEASLGNALLQVKGLDAKLKANKRALKEAQTHLDASDIEELAAAKQAAAQAVKEAEARAATAEDALAKVGQECSKREETTAKRMNDLSTSFGSKSFQSLKLYFFPAAQIWY